MSRETESLCNMLSFYFIFDLERSMSWLLISKEPWGPLSRNQTHPRPDPPSRPHRQDSGSGPRDLEKGTPDLWAGQALGVGLGASLCLLHPGWGPGSLFFRFSCSRSVWTLCVPKDGLFLLVSGFCSLHRESMFKDLLGTGGDNDSGSHSGGTEV